MFTSQRVIKGLYLCNLDGLEFLVENLGYRTKTPRWVYRAAWTKHDRSSKTFPRKKQAISALDLRRYSPEWTEKIGECLRKQAEYINALSPADREQLIEFYGSASAALTLAAERSV